MPVYEYQCDNCGLRFDKSQRFSDAPLTECPRCSGSLHKVIQPVGVIFKGSGFYVTDNRGKSSTNPPLRKEGDGKSSSDGSAGSESSQPAAAAPKPTESTNP